jgi:murein DD-endopeptidase MepM/ murein hydrolase activator NlpD
MLTFKIWLAALLSAALPFLAIAWLWRKRSKGWTDWALTLSVAAAISVLAFIATPWAATSYYLRYLLIPLFALAAFSSYRKLRAADLKNPTPAAGRLATAAKVITLAALLVLDAVAVRAYFYPVPPVELAFPLSGGVYYVIQGGNSVLTSPFHKNGSDNQEEYALDIVKLNRAGNRAAGIYPRALNSYAVYGATIHSPCDGQIVELRDGVPENPIGDKGSHPGNQIVIRCQGVRVTLAHMRSGSFFVQNGQSVKAGQPLAEVGNAGHTSEPHLHLDAVRDSAEGIEPLPVSFDGRVLSLNSVVIR